MTRIVSVAVNVPPSRHRPVSVTLTESPGASVEANAARSNFATSVPFHERTNQATDTPFRVRFRVSRSAAEAFLVVKKAVTQLPFDLRFNVRGSTLADTSRTWHGVPFVA